MTYDKTKPKM